LSEYWDHKRQKINLHDNDLKHKQQRHNTKKMQQPKRQNPSSIRTPSISDKRPTFLYPHLISGMPFDV